jgi:hypothetical protein
MKWVTRWKYEIAAKASRPGIWRLKTGGYLVRGRVTQPRTQRRTLVFKVLRNATVQEAQRYLDDRKSAVRDREAGKPQTRVLWSSYAASLFQGKVLEGKLKSAKSVERWTGTLKRLVPEIGEYYVDELRYSHLEELRDKWAGWMRDGMPSIKKGENGLDGSKLKIVKLAPVTANGWISILKTICSKMRRKFDLRRDPAEDLEYFEVGRTYSQEQPNALTSNQIPAFLAKMLELHPNHYAMTFLGFVTGARPSTLRPLRRQGPSADVLWDQGAILFRRSNSLKQEVMDETKTGLDQELPLPPAVMMVLRTHVAALPDGAMKSSELLFPSTLGGMRARSVLDKPFREVLAALKFKLRLTPRGMRRTFNDLARKADVHDVVTRAISGHQTDKMQKHYSTAEREEMCAAIGKVAAMVRLPKGQTKGQKGKR